MSAIIFCAFVLYILNGNGAVTSWKIIVNQGNLGKSRKMVDGDWQVCCICKLFGAHPTWSMRWGVDETGSDEDEVAEHPLNSSPSPPDTPQPNNDSPSLSLPVAASCSESQTFSSPLLVVSPAPVLLAPSGPAPPAKKILFPSRSGTYRLWSRSFAMPMHQLL